MMHILVLFLDNSEEQKMLCDRTMQGGTSTSLPEKALGQPRILWGS